MPRVRANEGASWSLFLRLRVGFRLRRLLRRRLFVVLVAAAEAEPVAPVAAFFFLRFLHRARRVRRLEALHEGEATRTRAIGIGDVGTDDPFAIESFVADFQRLAR